MMHENENDADGILAIIKSLHQYVPFYGEEDDRVYGEQGVVGDQLSVERGVNGHMSLANGFTPEQRGEGLNFEIADWHAGNKFLEVAFSNFYSVSSAVDKCTMYCDRNLVNRRNVKGDVSAAANPCRRFFQMEIETRVVAATMTILGMTKIDDKPSANEFGNSSDKEKKAYLHKIASLVVDTYVIDQERNRRLEESVQNMHHEEKPNADGRFPCRFAGCSKSFAHNGKVRKDHEAKHNPPVQIDEASVHVFDTPPKDGDDDNKRDDMFAYQKALLDYGMLILNFFDGISEGDGARVFRCWKYFLMYLKHQGGSANKYSLEALYLMFQANALLSPKSAHSLIWNRFIKNKSGLGGNIPLDLQLEFYNKSVKEAIKNIGPNASEKSINRVCHSIDMTMSLKKKFDVNLSVFKRSGKHVRKSIKGDFQKILKELLQNDAFQFTPKRKYRHYANAKTSILAGFDTRQMFEWINAHKKYMILNRRAR